MKEEEVGRQYRRVMGMDFTSTRNAAEDRTRWKAIVVKSSVVPQ